MTSVTSPPDGKRTHIQPLFKWAGSKQRMLPAYAPHFFPDQPFTRFVDLFGGGLTMTFWVAENYPDTELVINDFNTELVHLYRELSTEPEAVINVWQECVDQWLPLTPEERKAFYYTLREEYCLHYEGKSAARIAGLLLFMLQVNFNGMWKTYIKCGLRYSTPPGTCTQGVKFFQREKIEKVAAVLSNATILSGDFQDVPFLPGDFVYADPPYRDSIVEYQGGFGEAEQVRLAQHLQTHDGVFAYSNKDIGDGWYDTHFPNAVINVVDAKYTAGRGTSVREVKEVLITNYRSHHAPEELITN